MSEERQDREDETGDMDAPAPARVRFKGIVEQNTPVDGSAYGVFTVSRDERRWHAMSRQMWQASRLVAIFVFFSYVVGPPLGNYIAYQQIFGSSEGWNPLAAYGADTVLFAFVAPVLILLVGYAVSRMATMMNAAESIAAAAQQYVTPDVTAAYNADAVGEVVRGHMVALNEGLDGALTRLASVEAMIRQHVEAIEIAGDAIEHKATGAVTRVADERTRLMELTEALNAHADSFAAAIAEKAKTAIETLQSADQSTERVERDFDDRLHKLEQAAQQAVASFESLRGALQESTENFASSAGAVDDAAQQTREAISRANAIANAAAESAAFNASNAAAAANRAAESSRDAADEAIAAAARETERVARAALDSAADKSREVREATAQTIGEISDASAEAVDAARADAENAAKAAKDVTEAARLASEAAQKASTEIAAASKSAQDQSEIALQQSQAAAEKFEARNKALAEARAALEKENTRLETLIEEQRQRADRLADAISSQTERLTKLAETQLREQEATARRQSVEESMTTDPHPQTRKPSDGHRAPAPDRQPQTRDDTDPPSTGEEKSIPQDRKSPVMSLGRKRKIPPATKEPETSDGNASAARLETLARDIAERRPRRDAKPLTASKPEEKKEKGAVSWREILDAADEAEPLALGAEEKKDAGVKRDEAAEAIKIISGLQAFTYDLETRLYGEPPPALQERYDRGDRNVFANRLLRLNEADVKRRIRSESARDRDFEKGVHNFLHGFEKLLEDATTSDTADEELEEYLSSPLGRVYLLIGATVGYFA